MRRYACGKNTGMHKTKGRVFFFFFKPWLGECGVLFSVDLFVNDLFFYDEGETFTAQHKNCD